MRRVDHGSKYSALLLSQSECGDAGLIKQLDDSYLVTLIDGLGHGKEARKAALMAIEYIDSNSTLPLDKMISNVHQHIIGTRGAVIAVCRLFVNTGKLKFSGMGNISCKKFGSNPQSFVSKDGVIGCNISRPIEREYQIQPGDIIILHSDGVKSHFDINSLDKWSKMTAQDIAEDVFDKYKTHNDDASCIVLKYMS